MKIQSNYQLTQKPNQNQQKSQNFGMALKMDAETEKFIQKELSRVTTEKNSSKVMEQIKALAKEKDEYHINYFINYPLSKLSRDEGLDLFVAKQNRSFLARLFGRDEIREELSVSSFPYYQSFNMENLPNELQVLSSKLHPTDFGENIKIGGTAENYMKNLIIINSNRSRSKNNLSPSEQYSEIINQVKNNIKENEISIICGNDSNRPTNAITRLYITLAKPNRSFIQKLFGMGEANANIKVKQGSWPSNFKMEDLPEIVEKMAIELNSK